MKKIFCENTSYKYKFFKDDEIKEVDALKNVSIEVNGGEFISILGINGSGKSTFAKLLNALYKPSSGIVYVNGIDTSTDEASFEIRKYCGMVFQNPDNQIIGTVVEDDVAFGLENLGVNPIEMRERVHKALDEVGMLEFKGKQPNMLSGGQKQRVSIAGVLAMEPKCIILDEPTAMLDPTGRKKVLEIIKKLNKEENIMIVLITHFMEEAMESDRVIVMNDGEIEMEGIPAEVFQEVEKMKNLGLDVPIATEIAYKLRKYGVLLQKNILTIEDLIGGLCL